MQKAGLARLKPYRFSLVNAAAVFLIQMRTLAHAPQNPDGAEMIAVVEQGKGVLHTPGYPLQAWLNQVVGFFPIGSIAVRLALFSLSCQTLTVFLLSEIFRKLGVHPIASAIGVSFYAFFPPVWTMAVQPEKYALTGLTMVALIWASLRISESKAGMSSRKNQITLGVVVGLGFAQHLIFALTLPFAVFPFLLSKKSARERLSQTLVPALIAIAISSLFYLSLLVRSRGAVWPDWGKLSSLSDLYRHVSRGDFPIGRLSPISGAGLIFGALPIFISDYMHSFLIMGLLPIFGIVLAFNDKKRKPGPVFLKCTVGFLALSTLFLAMSRLHPPELVAYTYLERYSLPACLAVAILGGWAMNWLLLKLIRVTPRSMPAFFLLALGFPAMLALDAWPRVDMSYDRTLDIYREALGIGVDDQAVLIQGPDLDVFYGAKIGNHVRYPVFGDYPWAINKADYLIEPRLSWIMKRPAGITEIAQAAYQAGLTVISPNHDIAMANSKIAESRGLHWVTSQNTRRPVSLRTVEAALELCRLLLKMNYVLPKTGHYYSRSLLDVFRFPFYSAARYLDEIGKKDQHELALKVAFGLYRGDDPLTWIEGCQAFLKANAN